MDTLFHINIIKIKIIFHFFWDAFNLHVLYQISYEIFHFYLNSAGTFNASAECSTTANSIYHFLCNVVSQEDTSCLCHPIELVVIIIVLLYIFF
jgi:hypothetical protein